VTEKRVWRGAPWTRHAQEKAPSAPLKIVDPGERQWPPPEPELAVPSDKGTIYTTSFAHISCFDFVSIVLLFVHVQQIRFLLLLQMNYEEWPTHTDFCFVSFCFALTITLTVLFARLF
jgi:hypothetical protein